MTDLQTAMIERIGADTDLSAAFGGRVHWNTVPQGTAKPYLTLKTISDPRERNLKTAQRSRRPRIQADVYAETYDQARSLSEALIELFEVAATTGGVRFGGAAVSGPRDLGEDTPDGFVHRLSTDLRIQNSVI